MDVHYPGFGTIVVGAARFDHDIVVEGGRVRPRKKGPSKAHRDRYGHTPLSVDEELPWAPPQLVIGTGASGRLPIMPEIWKEAEDRGVTLLALPTAEACALLRTMQQSDVYAVLHVTC